MIDKYVGKTLRKHSKLEFRREYPIGNSYTENRSFYPRGDVHIKYRIQGDEKERECATRRILCLREGNISSERNSVVVFDVGRVITERPSGLEDFRCPATVSRISGEVLRIFQSTEGSLSAKLHITIS